MIIKFKLSGYKSFKTETILLFTQVKGEKNSRNLTGTEAMPLLSMNALFGKKQRREV